MRGKNGAAPSRPEASLPEIFSTGFASGYSQCTPAGNPGVSATCVHLRGGRRKTFRYQTSQHCSPVGLANSAQDGLNLCFVTMESMLRRCWLVILAVLTAILPLPAKTKDLHAAFADAIDGQRIILGIALGADTVKSAQDHLGKSRVFRDTSGDDPRNELCYEGEDAVVVFESGQEGGWSDLTGFVLSNKERQKEALPFCSAMPKQPSRPTTKGGIHLGMNREEVIDVLGSPDKKNSNSITYQFAGERGPTVEEKQAWQQAGMPPRDKIPVTMEVVATFEADALVVLSVTYVEAY